MSEEQHSKYNGTWLIPEIPKEFNKILKEIGYSKVERHVFKKSKVLIHSSFKDDVLTLKIDSSMYKNTHDYHLNSNPIEFTDDRKNQIIEISNWIGDNKIQTKTIYIEKGITLIDTRELLESGDCRHNLVLHKGVDDPIETEVVYARINPDK